MAGKKRKAYSVFGEEEADDDDGKEQTQSSPSDESNSQDGHSSPSSEENDSSAQDGSPSQVSYMTESEDLDDDSSSAASDQVESRVSKKDARKYRDLMDSMASTESANLTRQLLTHFKASRKNRLESSTTGIHMYQWNMRADRNYTAWPVEAITVPRQNNLVWPDSEPQRQPWKPSGDLEDAVFSSMLRQARLQWNEKLQASENHRRVQKEAVESKKRVREALGGDDSSSASALAASKWIHDLNQQWSYLKPEADEADDPVFSADEERCFKILKPSVRSVISTVDKLLLGLHKSNNAALVQTIGKDATISNKKRKNGEYKVPKRVNRIHPRDWSSVLGMAGLVGISTSVLSRTTTRCAAIFDEGMEFAAQRECDTCDPPTIAPILPSDFSASPERDRLTGGKPYTWNYRMGCPFKECAYQPPITTQSQIIQDKVFKHLAHVHRWRVADRHIKPLAKLVPGTPANTLHLDGFLQPIRRIAREVPSRRANTDVSESESDEEEELT